jgi:hypothetical protein
MEGVGKAKEIGGSGESMMTETETDASDNAEAILFSTEYRHWSKKNSNCGIQQGRHVHPAGVTKILRTTCIDLGMP